jgi:hypothetical protein
MKIITKYQANDGIEFFNEKSCSDYEDDCNNVAAANEMFKNGANLLDSLIRANQWCATWDSCLNIEDKVILLKITKDTGFSIPHWQCSDKPYYKIILIKHNNLFNVFGGTSNPYGNDVKLSDLLRYYRNTYK